MAVLAVIIVVQLAWQRNRHNKKLPALTLLSFALVRAGLFTGANRLLGYGLIGLGILLLVIDMVLKLKANKRKVQECKKVLNGLLKGL